MENSKPLIFAGSASGQLGFQIAKLLDCPLGNFERTQFRNSEIRIRVLDDVKGLDCFVVQSTASPVQEHIFELLLLTDTLKKSGAATITGVIPYFGYSRQHASFRQGECVTTDMILRMLANLGMDRIITADFHNVDALTGTPLPVRNMSVLSPLAQAVKNDLSPEQLVIVSPDEGGKDRAQEFARYVFGSNPPEIAYIKKTRDLDKAHTLTHNGLVGEVKNKIVLLVDDICTTGGTLAQAARVCLEQGAKDVRAAVIHADMTEQVMEVPGMDLITKFYITDTIAWGMNVPDTIQIVKIASALAVEVGTR